MKLALAQAQARDRRARRTPATRVELCDNELDVQPYRASGPGGQHRNKTATAIRLTHVPTGLVVAAEESRSQHQNLQSARAKLVDVLSRAQDQSLLEQIEGERNAQIASGERPAKAFTHNDQRGEVVCHETGERWGWREFYAGRVAGLASGKYRA